jgi:hypothetical protein
MNKTKLATLILILTTGTIFGQSDLCFDNDTGTYWPIKAGKKIKYYSRGESYTSYFNGDSLKVGDKYFLKEIKEYTSGQTKTSYWREESGVVYFYDVERKAESIELTNNLTPGTTWEKYDKTWKYTIVDTASSFATPFCELKNLLQVKAEPQNELKDKMHPYYNLFYKRGVGMVGMNVNGEPFTYAKPSKEINERNFIAYGCESIASNEEQQKCTYAKIYGFINKELKAPKKKDYKSGRIVLNVTVGQDGAVDDVKIIETIAGAELQEKELIRVISMLPKMIPAQVDDGQPIRSSFKIPIKF